MLYSLLDPRLEGKDWQIREFAGGKHEVKETRLCKSCEKVQSSGSVKVKNEKQVIDVFPLR